MNTDRSWECEPQIDLESVFIRGFPKCSKKNAAEAGRGGPFPRRRKSAVPHLEVEDGGPTAFAVPALLLDVRQNPGHCIKNRDCGVAGWILTQRT
jgi:hypothetical protein